MATTFLYRCPNTRQTVQGWSADEVTDDDEYQSIACLACAQLHLVNPKTGKVLGGERGLSGLRAPHKYRGPYQQRPAARPASTRPGTQPQPKPQSLSGAFD